MSYCQLSNVSDNWFQLIMGPSGTYVTVREPGSIAKYHVLFHPSGFYRLMDEAVSSKLLYFQFYLLHLTEAEMLTSPEKLGDGTPDWPDTLSNFVTVTYFRRLLSAFLADCAY